MWREEGPRPVHLYTDEANVNHGQLLARRDRRIELVHPRCDEAIRHGLGRSEEGMHTFKLPGVHRSEFGNDYPPFDACPFRDANHKRP